MPAVQRASTKLVSKAGFSALAALCLIAGCAGARGLCSIQHTRVERFTQLLSFETRRQQSNIVRRSEFYRDAHLEEFIAQILCDLTPPHLPEGIAPRVILVANDAVNAYSFPDGAIYIHTSLLTRLENEAELALVLAHELAHVTHRHALRAFMAYQEIKNSAAAEHGRSHPGAGARDLTAWFGTGEFPEAMCGILRSLEVEADRIGIDMIVKAGYNFIETLEIFEHLKEDGQNFQSAGRAAEMREAFADIRPLGRRGRLTDRQAFDTRLHNLLLNQAARELQHGHFDRALQSAQRCSRASPTDARCHFVLGEILRQRNHPGDHHLALRHYHLSIASDPSLAGSRKAIGLIYLKQGQARLAKSFFETALALNPNAPDSAYIHAYLDQCTTQIEGGDL
jgi:predicted Zn-dependent protease